MKKLTVAFTAAVVVALSACSPSPAPTPDVSQPQSAKEEASPAVAENTAVKNYFDAYAESDPDSMRSAAKNATKGSTAQKYMNHQANVVEANDATGYERYIQEASYDGGTVTVCFEGDECGEFTELAFEDNKLASFQVDGLDITERIALGDGAIVKSSGVAGFEVLSSYQTVEGSLMAVVRFYAYERPISFSYTASYRKPNGQQIDSSDSELPSRVAADSNQDAIVIFPHSENGGDLHLKFATDDDEEAVAGDLIVETVEVALP